MSAAEHPWGRVDTDGNVFLKEGDSERLIGQWPGGDPAEAIALYEQRFAGLEVEVDLLERRLGSGALSPDDASRALTLAREQVVGAQALGDLASLVARLDALAPTIETLREARRAEREERLAEARETKSQIAAEAEQIATGSDWHNGADRLRELLEDWKKLPRLTKSVDDELWHRFSTARTAYTKRRKSHFAEQSAQRENAQRIKEQLIVEAEALSDSTDWGPTASRYRELMQQWKRAGAAPRKVEDRLWKQFRAAQDKFFGAREAVNAQLDAEYEANAEVKSAILIEAEALLPIKDLDAARQAWQEIASRWEAAGKVPRNRVKEFEGRIRSVERAIRDAEDREWKRTDPEKSARADDMIAKLEAAIAEAEANLARAEESGDTAKAKKLRENLESRRSFLEIARRTASDFS